MSEQIVGRWHAGPRQRAWGSASRVPNHADVQWSGKIGTPIGVPVYTQPVSVHTGTTGGRRTGTVTATASRTATTGIAWATASELARPQRQPLLARPLACAEVLEQDRRANANQHDAADDLCSLS